MRFIMASVNIDIKFTIRYTQRKTDCRECSICGDNIYSLCMYTPYIVFENYKIGVIGIDITLCESCKDAIQSI